MADKLGTNDQIQELLAGSPTNQDPQTDNSQVLDDPTEQLSGTKSSND